jgi:hypothetical protein
MYPYTKELTLDEAYLLPERITVYSPITKQDPIDVLSVFNLSYIYDNNNAVYCTPLDYATHILKQAAPPEGYGYAAYDYGTGRYNGLEFMHIAGDKGILPFKDVEYMANNWADYLFRLTDLARVEGTDKTEISLNQAKWLKGKEQRFTYWLNGSIYANGLFIEADIYNIKGGDKYEIHTSTYNSLPQEFKDLEQRKNINLDQVKWIENNELPIQIHYCGYDGIKIAFSEFIKLPKEFHDLAPYNEPPIPPSGIRPPVNDWEAKYKELEDRYNESNNKRIVAETQLMHAKKRIEELEYYKSISDDYVKALENRDTARENLKQAEHELAKAHSNYYPY